MPTLTLQPHAAPAAALPAFSAMSSMPASTERAHQLHQVHVAADLAVARLHALDRRQRKPGQLGEPPLIDAEQGPGGAHLGRRDHVWNVTCDVPALQADV